MFGFLSKNPPFWHPDGKVDRLFLLNNRLNGGIGAASAHTSLIVVFCLHFICK